MKKYPDELTLDEFDDMPWTGEKQFGLEKDANIDEIKKYAKKIDGQIYTQVDGEEVGSIPKVSDLSTGPESTKLSSLTDMRLTTLDP